MSVHLGRDIFREKRPRRRVVLEIPELGGTVIVQAMNAREKGEYEAQFLTAKGELRKSTARARELLAIEVCVDEEGNKLFTPDDLEMLGNVDANILDRINKANLELSDINKDNSKNVEELAKN